MGESVHTKTDTKEILIRKRKHTKKVNIATETTDIPKRITNHMNRACRIQEDVDP